MTRKTRFIIFLAFLAAFAVAAPIVVLVTAGYQFSWRGQRVAQAALLRMESAPKGARIILNGAPRGDTTPATLTLPPGDYTVRVEREGYSAWEKRLVLSSGLTTFAEQIRLWKQDPPRLITAGVPSSTPREDTIAPTARRALIKKLGRAVGESAFAHDDRYYAVRQGLESPTLVELRLDPPTIVREIHPVPATKLTVIPGGGNFLALRDPISHILLVINLNESATERLGYQNGATVARWFDVKGGPKLLFTDGHDLYRYDPAGPQYDASFITRRESEITDFVLFPDDAHALYVTGGMLEAIEFDDRDRRNSARWEGLLDVSDLRLETSLLRASRLIVSGRTEAQGQGLYEIELE